MGSCFFWHLLYFWQVFPSHNILWVFRTPLLFTLQGPSSLLLDMIVSFHKVPGFATFKFDGLPKIINLRQFGFLQSRCGKKCILRIKKNKRGLSCAKLRLACFHNISSYVEIRAHGKFQLLRMSSSIYSGLSRVRSQIWSSDNKATQSNWGLTWLSLAISITFER